MLYSTDRGFSYSTRAFSGGGRGSTAGLARSDLAHWSTSKKAPGAFDATDRGGPLPTGHYVVKYLGKYKKFGECARLEQTLTSLIHVGVMGDLQFTKRDGFLIHGDGPRGSDGCIVPASKAALKTLLAYIKSAKQTVLLEVHSEGMRTDRLEGRGPVDTIA